MYVCRCVNVVTCLMPIDGFGLIIRFIARICNSGLQLTVALSLIRTRYSSLQHALRLLSLLCLHWTLPGNGSSASVFSGLRLRWQKDPLLCYCLRTAACLDSTIIALSKSVTICMCFYICIYVAYIIQSHDLRDLVKGEFHTPKQ
jgi:hypothetical protein